MMKTVFNEKCNCCGCTACEKVCPTDAISMMADKEGFLYPEIDEKKCIDCGACRRVCAFANGTDMEQKTESIVYALKASDEIRRESSSGGMFTLISDEILARGGVVYGVAFDENFKAVHIRADSLEKRNLCRGSKYSQSDLADTFSSVKTDVESGIPVMFTGTSCQCAALNKFLDKTDKSGLLIVDIICHGTPSPKLFSEYIGFLKRERKKCVSEYYHRSKDAGWDHNEKIVYSDGSSEIKTALSEAWKNIFYSNAPLRPSCYNCKYTSYDRKSDITIADFWGIDMYDKEFNDKKGISLVITNTKKGEDMFDIVSSKAVFKKRTFEEAAKCNINLKKPSESYVNRDDFWRDYEIGGIDLIVKKYGQYNLFKKFKILIKRLLGK